MIYGPLIFEFSSGLYEAPQGDQIIFGEVGGARVLSAVVYLNIYGIAAHDLELRLAADLAFDLALDSEDLDHIFLVRDSWILELSGDLAVNTPIGTAELSLRFTTYSAMDIPQREGSYMEIYRQSITDKMGNAIPDVTITVKSLAGVIVDIYEDQAGTVPLANPLMSDENGFFSFAAPDGSYRIEGAGTYQGSPFTFTSVITLFDPEDMSLFSSDPADVNKGVLWGDLFTNLQYVPPNGAGAAGTWDISISGNAATASIATAINEALGYRMRALGVNVAIPVQDGDIAASGNITSGYSDERLKILEGKIQNALEKLLMISGYYYRGNAKAEELGGDIDRQVGVSAQEVQEILPEVVTMSPLGEEYLTVRYERLIPLIIEAIKELNEEVEALKDVIKGS